MDMEMTPDTLEDIGVNELFVTVTVDVSFTTEQDAILSYTRTDKYNPLIMFTCGILRVTNCTLNDDSTLSLHHVLFCVANVTKEFVTFVRWKFCSL